MLGELQISMSSDFSCSVHINSFFYQQGAFKRFTNSTFAMHTCIAKNLIKYKINIWSVLWNSLAPSMD